jgi:type I restriction enzyme S subunit
MHWIAPTTLRHKRIDPYYYMPEHLETERLIQDVSKRTTFDMLGSFAHLWSGPFGSKLPSSLYRESGPYPLYRSQNVKPFWIQREGLVFLEVDAYEELKACEATVGDILVSKAGFVGTACILGKDAGPSIITEHVLGIRPLDETDPYYLLAALNASICKRQLEREGLGTLLDYLGVEVSRELMVPLPRRSLQIAIGNKVRAAESLRQIAAISKQQAAKILAEDLKWNIQWTQSSALSTWILPTEIENRFDGRYNSNERIAALRHLRLHGLENKPLAELAEISGMIGWKGLTTEYYTDHGPLLVRGIDFEDGIIQIEKLVHVDKQKYEEQPQIHLLLGDIVLTKDGTIGKVCVIPPINEQLCAGSTVARIRGFGEVVPYYLEAILTHEVVQVWGV